MNLHICSIAAVLPSDENWKEGLPASLKRRTPLIWQLSYQAASKAMAQSTLAPEAVICATALGALDETVVFLDKVLDTGFGAPRQFIASVHNSMAGVLAKELTITGANITLCDSNSSLSSALLTATALTEQTFLIIAVDEQIELFNQIAQNCRGGEGFIDQEHTGAVAMIVQKTVDTTPYVSTTPPAPSLEAITQSSSFITPALNLATALQNQKSKQTTTATTIECSSITAQALSTITLTH